MVDDEFWVFAYGSLLWDTGFEVLEQRHATIFGYERSFCMLSIHHRGTVDRPGLVLALVEKRGAECAGVGLHCPLASMKPTLELLRERELVSSAYEERVVEIRLAGGGVRNATVFVMDTSHEQYCGEMPVEDQARVIAEAKGNRGLNRDYLFSTVDKLVELGIRDHRLEELRTMVVGINTSGAPRQQFFTYGIANPRSKR